MKDPASDNKGIESQTVQNESTNHYDSVVSNYGMPPRAPKLRPIPDPSQVGYDPIAVML